MAQNIHHFENFSVIRDGVTVEVDMKRLENNFNRAQFALDSAIMTSMEPLMPRRDGNFIAITEGMSAAIAGTGKVVAAAPPYGRFLYEGATMVDVKTGSPWARKGAKKVKVSEFQGKTNASPNLTYSGNGQSHWFEKAKEKDLDSWVKVVENIVGEE